MSNIVFIKAINNSSIVEKTKEYEGIIEWEVRHQCIGDVWDTLTKEDVEKRQPLHCMLCGKDIIKFDEVRE